MWTIDPKIPLSLWWVLAIGALAAIAWYGVRRDWPISFAKRIILTALLLLGVTGPLLITLNPTWIETIPPIPGNPLLTVLVDGTMSMSTEDGDPDQEVSRWNRALKIASSVDNRGTNLEIRRMGFGEHLEPLQSSEDQNKATPGNPIADHIDQGESTWPKGHRSDLASALRETTRTGSPVGHAILMISDGAHNVGSVESVLQSAREANALATPVYTVTIGTSIGMKNMSLTTKSPRMIAFPDTPVSVRATVRHNGLAGQTTAVALMRDGETLQSQMVRLNSNPVQEIRFLLEDGVKAPIERLHIVASDVPEEVTTADNQTTVLVQRLNAPIGVLFLEGKPYWDSKFLTRNLSNDPVVKMDSLIQLGPNRFLRRAIKPPPIVTGSERENQPAFSGTGDVDDTSDSWSIVRDLESPLESMELLESYRLVILGRDAGSFLTQAAIVNLRLWISQGGGCLLCSRGAPTDQIVAKLSEILPVRWMPGSESRFRTRLSGHGIDSSVFDPLLTEGVDPLGSLPSLATGAIPKIRVGLPQVLVQSTEDGTGQSIPVVTYQPYGSGQTVVVEGAGMWRWAFLPPEHAQKDKIYATLWQSMIQWIVSQQDVMPGQEVAIRTDRANFLSGDPATASVTLKDPSAWEQSGGAMQLGVTLQSAGQDLPSRLTLVPSGMEAGLYRVDLGSLDVGFYSLKVVQGVQDEVLAATAFEVRDPWFESLEVDARPDIMRQVARLSGGQELQPDEVGDLVERFAQRLKDAQNHEEIRTTMWDRPLVLIAILAGWIMTWIVRRKNGMV